MSDFAPFVSIIIPVYNGSNYLRQAIDSALTQEYSNFEVLVINDGSTDNGATKKIAESYGGKIRYFEKPNGGVATALNMGIEQMRGDYFSWLSHDDLYEKNKLSRQIIALSTKSPEVRAKTIVYSEWTTVDKDGYPLGRVRIDGHFPEERLKLPLYPLIYGILHGCAMLVPVGLLREASGFDSKLRTTQDYDLWHKILPKAEVFFVPESLIKSRVHAEQDSKKITTHHSESDDLWFRIYSSLSVEDMIRFEGSEGEFLIRLADVLKHAGALQTRLRVLTRLSQLPPSLNTGVWLSAESQPEKLVSRLESLSSGGQITDIRIFGVLSAELEKSLKIRFRHFKFQFVDSIARERNGWLIQTYGLVRPYLAWIFKRSGLALVREWSRSYLPRRQNG